MAWTASEQPPNAKIRYQITRTIESLRCSHQRHLMAVLQCETRWLFGHMALQPRVILPCIRCAPDLYLIFMLPCSLRPWWDLKFQPKIQILACFCRIIGWECKRVGFWVCHAHLLRYGSFRSKNDNEKLVPHEPLAIKFRTAKMPSDGSDGYIATSLITSVFFCNRLSSSPLLRTKHPGVGQHQRRKKWYYLI